MDDREYGNLDSVSKAASPYSAKLSNTLLSHFPVSLWNLKMNDSNFGPLLYYAFCSYACISPNSKYYCLLIFSLHLDFPEFPA